MVCREVRSSSYQFIRSFKPASAWPQFVYASSSVVRADVAEVIVRYIFKQRGGKKSLHLMLLLPFVKLARSFFCHD